MTAVYHDMEPFDDVRNGLAHLKVAGYDLGVISNDDPAMLESMVGSADIDDLLTTTVSATRLNTTNRPWSCTSTLQIALILTPPRSRT